MLNGCALLPGAEFYVAVDNAGLWPNLTLTPDGEILAAAYDYPGHGVGNGNIGVWASTDRGRTWQHRGTATAHGADDDSARLNQACGLNARGEYVVLAGLWTGNIHEPGPVQVCVSGDAGRTWRRHDLENTRDAGVVHPFGDIILCPDGRLACAIHNDTEGRSYVYWSHDDGETWEHRDVIAEDVSETALLACGRGRWLAAARRRPVNSPDLLRYCGETQLFASSDDGKAWTLQDTITLPRQAPGHLLKLSTGEILFTTTSRIDGAYGVLVRVSSDDGSTWSTPRFLISMPVLADCGYPCSVQLEDHTIVTAYYFGPKNKSRTIDHTPGGLPWHRRYHMGIARWRLGMLAQGEVRPCSG